MVDWDPVQVRAYVDGLGQPGPTVRIGPLGAPPTTLLPQVDHDGRSGTFPYPPHHQQQPVSSSTSAATNTAASTNSDPLVPGSPGTTEPEILQLLQGLRDEKKDADVGIKLHASPKDVVLAVSIYLSSHREMVLDLCHNERGRIITHVMALLRRSATYDIFSIVMSDIHQLAFSPSGCIAICRIYDSAPKVQRAEINRFCLDQFIPLAVHPYGNYLVQKVITKMEPATLEHVVGIMSHADNVRALAFTKSGSHVLEKLCGTPVAPTISATILTPALIASLSQDPFGNYVLQQAIRFVRSDAAKAVEYEALLAAVPGMMKGSPYEANILRSLQAPVVPFVPEGSTIGGGGRDQDASKMSELPAPEANEGRDRILLRMRPSTEVAAGGMPTTAAAPPRE